MSRDKRKKGCPNEECVMNNKKHKFSAYDVYCPRCGTKLVFVCAKCFKKIMTDDKEHRYCALCEAKKSNPKAIKHAKQAVKQIDNVRRIAVNKVRNTGK